MKLKVGFIGLGAMGLSHVNSIERLCADTAEVSAFCDTSPQNLKSALEVAHNAKVYRKSDDLMRSQVDAIFVSTPNFTHAMLAADILAAGKHLFLEKPCGITKEECLAVLAASKASKC